MSYFSISCLLVVHCEFQYSFEGYCKDLDVALVIFGIFFFILFYFIQIVLLKDS